MLQRLAVPSLFSFTAIIFREVLMDCADEQGEALGPPAQTSGMVRGARSSAPSRAYSALPATGATGAAGDRQSGVVTLPVLMGPAAALLLATVLLLGGALAAISGLLTSNIPLAASSTADAAATTAVQVAGAAVAQHALPLSVAWPHLACAGLIGLCVLKLVGQVRAAHVCLCAHVWRCLLRCRWAERRHARVARSRAVAQVVHVYASGMSEAAISSAVDDCIKPVGLAIVMLAAMA